MPLPVTEQPVPPMTVTAGRFIELAWDLNLQIVSAESSLLDTDFIKEASALARAKGVEVHYLDFSRYKNPQEALTSAENVDFIRAIEIEDSTQQRLLWFDNCDSLAPLSCNITYTLRSILTTRISTNTQSVFIAEQASLDLMFSNNKAAFYHSNYPITERKNAR